MGGLAGHMSHLYDNPELKFREIEDIMAQASSGALVGTEKTDGQNIFISYSQVDGKAKAARNLGNLKTGGMDAAGLAAKFKGRGDLEKSFSESFEAFERAVGLLDDETQYKIFGPNANIWYNAEVQDPRTSNVINYNAKSLTIHRLGHKELNEETGRPMDKDVSANLGELEKALDSIKDIINDEEYKVQINAVRNLRGLSDDIMLKNSLTRLRRVMSKAGLGEENTVSDFLVTRVSNFVSAAAPEINEEARKQITKRLLKIKGVTLNTIYRILDNPEQRAKVKEIVNRQKEIVSKSVFPLEDIVHDFSVEMLKGLESAFVLDNEAEVERLRGEVARAISAIEKASSDEATEILVKQMKKLKDIENVSTAAEGFVFDYNGMAYKFTGNFAPINQILGLFRYGRGNIPPMELNEDEQDTMADLALVPGSFKPPHKGHLELMKKYLKYAKKVEVLISDPNMGGESIRWIDLPSHEGEPLKAMIDADTAADLFDHYIELEGLSDKITVPRIWKGNATNPIQYSYEKIAELEKNKTRASVILGVSTKDKGDEKRFKNSTSRSRFADYEYVRVKDMPLEPDSEGTRAKDFRDAITRVFTMGDTNTLMSFLPSSWIKKYKDQSASVFLDMIEKAPVVTNLDESKIKEESGVASIQGSAGGPKDEETLIREEDEEMSEYMIDREEFIKELALREHIRSQLEEKCNNELSQEEALRSAIRNMINEEISETPHASTGINELEQLLKKVIPVIEPDYKSLTTSVEQRESYRAHIVKAVQNSLSPAAIDVARDSRDIKPLELPDEEEMMFEPDMEEDISIEVGEKEKFIDIDGDKKKKDDEEDSQAFNIDGMEETGRNFASMTWERIETNIIDSYRKLSARKDKELFYDYLIANLKLYFDKFEDELSATVREPDSEIYDQEKGV